jgi:predicted RNA-binding protein Jag
MSEGPAAAPQKKSTAKDRSRNAAPLDGKRAAEELQRFLDLVLHEMNLATKYEILPAPHSRGGDDTHAAPTEADGVGTDADIVVRFGGADEDILLSRNGELLLALEHLAHRWLRLEPAMHDRVRFDCGDYRATRLEELKLSARVAAQRVRETGQPFRFNPMSSRDRRTIHLELNGAPGVRTMSEGSGDRRHLVVYPAATTKR